jgi:UDP-glucose 4-epimerase
MFFLVTGGLGYLGSRLVEKLLNDGHRVRVTTRRPPKSFPQWAKDWEIKQVDPCEIGNWLKALNEIDFVFHLAAPDAEAAVSDPISALKAGGEMAWKLLEAVTNAKKKPPVLNISTYHVYGSEAEGLITESILPKPVHPYAVGHLVSEMVVRTFCHTKGISVLNVRLSNAFGRPIAYTAAKWSLVFNDLCMQAATSNSLKLNSAGRQKRNFITLEDAVSGLLYLAGRAEDWPDDHTIHLGSKIFWSIKEVAEKIRERTKVLWGKYPEISFPKGGLEPKSKEFRFDVSRIERLGFIWQNRFEKEVDETLIACERWGKNS